MAARNDARGSAAPLVLALVVVATWAALSPPGANDLVGGDEGYYGVMARNVLADPAQALGPSLTPLGPPGDKPPLYPLMLAASLRLFGTHDWALRWTSYALAVLVLAGAGAVARAATGSRIAGITGALLLAALPWFADAARVVAAEMAVAALGTAALVVLTRGARASADPMRIEPATSGARAAALAGVLLGAAFLCKLWLVAPFVIAALLWLLPARRPGGWLAFGLGFGLVAPLHLVLVQVLRPGDLQHWWNVYSGFSLASRVGGEGYAGYWIQPPDFYLRTLAQALVLVLPLVAFGVAAAVARWREPGPRLVLGWALGAALLSAFRVKSGAYLLPIVPAFAVLAAMGAHALATRARAPLWVPLVIAAATAPALLARDAGPAPAALPWIAAWVLAALSLLATRLGRWLGAWSAALFVAFAALGGFAREAVRLPQRYHDVGYRAAAAALAPHLAGLPPDRRALLAPEAPAFAFYTFHRAGYWDTPYEPWTPVRAADMARDTALRAFVVDTTGRAYGGRPDDATITWLAREAREITADVARARGRPMPLRVWVRRASGETDLGARTDSATLNPR